MKTRLTEANTKLDQTSKDKFVLDRENRSLKETLHTHEKTLKYNMTGTINIYYSQLAL
jgi:hypothetical protein